MKELLSNQMSPASHNGGSIIQNLTSSQSSVYSGTFSNNSRFTNTRPVSEAFLIYIEKSN